MENDPHKYEKVELEIYMMFRKNSGILSTVSGYLQRNDSSKLSRQISPTDTRRDNPFRETLEILEAVNDKSPELASEIFGVIQREWELMRHDSEPKIVEFTRLFKKLFTELSDVVCAQNNDASQEVLEKESYELMQVCKELHENIVANGKSSRLRKIK